LRPRVTAFCEPVAPFQTAGRSKGVTGGGTGDAC
jgi:hypothetical protein